jgi:hypothetical protein
LILIIREAGQEDVAKPSGSIRTRPWTVAIHAAHVAFVRSCPIAT